MDPFRDRERWTIDSETSNLTFSLRHALLGQIKGEFRCWGGDVLLDRADPSRSSVRIWVELSSIDTGSRRRDDDILDTELFDVSWEPALVFESERFETDDRGQAVMFGLLNLHSYRKNISVSIDASLPREDGAGAPRLVGTARASIDRGALGLRRAGGVSDWLNERFLDKAIEMTAHVEATRQAPVRPALDRGCFASPLGPRTAALDAGERRVAS
jgi:polyisoprenoid-binding protein YceI